ncbi:MAG: PIN domain-containing protein [Ignavibacteriaceae bacterium]
MANKPVISDSNILIWHLRGMPEIVNGVLSLISQNILFVTPVVIAEIIAGAKKKEEEIISNMFSSMHIIEINEEMGKIAGRFLNEFSKSHDLKIADALIASAAVCGKMKLWTLSKKHYPMLNKNDFYEI